LSESSFRTILVVLGLSQLALAAWQIVSPGSFYDSIAGFGAQNDHYIRDAAAFPLAIGIGLLVVVGRPSWRFPVLLVSAVWYLAHAVNHLFDIGDADPSWVGPADFVALALTGALLAWLTYLSGRSDTDEADARSAPAPSPEPSAEDEAPPA
jgi:hypothetical protein